MSRRPKYYPINSIRSKFQTVAIDNKYQVFMEPNLNVYNAAAHIGIPRRFVDEDLGLYASEAVLPGSSFADVEVSGDRQGITCLLYTSPSPRDLSTSRMPSSA